MDSLIQVTLVANAGLLLRYQDSSILLDALFSGESCSFCEASPATRERLLRGDSPFDSVDYVLFTHLHEDHFSEALTREFLLSHRVKGLVLPYSERLEQRGFFDFVQESGTPCHVLTWDSCKAEFRLSDTIRISALRTLHLDEKYHGVLHFCYLISCGEKKLLFTSDVDYTREQLSFLGSDKLRAAFVNPLFFSDLQRRRFFHGRLPAETIVVYHLPFSEKKAGPLQRMFSRSLQVWPENGPPVIVLEGQLETIEL